MIPHSSGGQQWGHPIRALNGGPGRVDLAQASAQYDSPSITSQLLLSSPSHHRSLSQTRPVVDLTTADSQDREPVPKRPRLDVSGASNLSETGAAANGGETKNTPGSAGSRHAPSWRGRPMWSFQAVMSELPTAESRGENATSSKPASPPPLPTQSWNTTVVGRTREETSSQSRDPSPDKKVQTTPYRIETPSAAPVLQADSKFFRDTYAGLYHSSLTIYRSCRFHTVDW